MNNKITAEEIQQLRQNAENERTTHAKVTQLIHSVEIGAAPPLSASCQMEIVSRKRESEIIALLEVYDKKFGQNPDVSLSDEAQVFIYDDTNKLPKAKEYMLRYLRICHQVECRIYDDDQPLFYKEKESVKEFYPAFSSEGEKYIVEGTLRKCMEIDRVNGMVTDEMYFLNGYTKEHKLSDEGEVALMKFLSVTCNRSQVFGALEDFVISYIARYGELCIDAQMAMVRADSHKVIMNYITQSHAGIQNSEVVKELLNRADREEVTAYFERYAEEE